MPSGCLEIVVVAYVVIMIVMTACAWWDMDRRHHHHHHIVVTADPTNHSVIVRVHGGGGGASSTTKHRNQSTPVAPLGVLEMGEETCHWGRKFCEVLDAVCTPSRSVDDPPRRGHGWRGGRS